MLARIQRFNSIFLSNESGSPIHTVPEKNKTNNFQIDLFSYCNVTLNILIDQSLIPQLNEKYFSITFNVKFIEPRTDL